MRYQRILFLHLSLPQSVSHAKGRCTFFWCYQVAPIIRVLSSVSSPTPLPPPLPWSESAVRDEARRRRERRRSREIPKCHSLLPPFLPPSLPRLSFHSSDYCDSRYQRELTHSPPLPLLFPPMLLPSHRRQKLVMLHAVCGSRSQGWMDAGWSISNSKAPRKSNQR